MNPDNNKTSTVNFDDLVERLKSNGNQEGMDNLYRNFFLLEEWIFVSPIRTDVENAKPFIGVIDDKPWLFVFTDNIKAKEFCNVNEGFVKENGSINIIKMKNKNAIEMAKELYNRGVYGIRVNEGEYGWFFPIENIDAMLSYLKISY